MIRRGSGVMSIGIGCEIMRNVMPGEGADTRPASSACDPSSALQLATIAMLFVARITHGLEWPNSEGRAPQGNVIARSVRVEGDHRCKGSL